MHHSVDLANGRYLLSSTRPWAEFGATMAVAPWLAWDVIIRLRQAGQ
jgi:hypothetical protein